MKVTCSGFTAAVLVPLIALTAGCNSATTSTTAPSAVKCAVTLAPPQNALDAGPGAGSVTVTTTAECAWTATEDVSWISGLSPASGQGSGTIQFQVAANPAASIRQADIAVNNILARVTQSGTACTLGLSAAGQAVAASGGSGTVAVTAPIGCAWTATSDAPWLTISSGATGSGSGAVEFSAAPNTGAARVGTVMIGGQAFSVTQPSPAPVPGPCTVALNPTSAPVGVAGATGLTVSVTTPAGCAWTATASDPWITITAGASGSGNGTVTYNVAANAGPSRTGTITVAGLTHTITQAATVACTVAIDPTSQSAPAGGGAGLPIAVTAPAGCAWTATTSDPWITITAGASGSGDGSVAFTIAVNPGSARVGTITIGGQVFTVNQAGSCASTIDPISQAVAAAGGAATPVAVTIPAACAWTATTAETWIAITGGTSGTGNGTVEFTVTANVGPLRTGLIAIAGQIHTVTQASGCVYSIDPTSQSFNKQAHLSDPIAVTTTADCPWTATSNAPWITVTVGASGTGNGTVRFSITANDTGDARIGTLTIAGLTFTVNQGK